MDNRSYDVVVIGGGPAGCMAARSAAEAGLSVLVAEKDPDIGAPVRCAEAMAIAHLKQYLDVDPAWCRQKVGTARIVAPDGTAVEVADVEPGYIVERKILDRKLAEVAVAAGAKVRTSMDAVGADRLADGTVAVHFSDREDVRAKIVIAADGTESRAGRWLGVQTAAKPDEFYSCAQYLLAGIQVEPECLQLHFGNEVAPGGYFWVFPKGPDVANVGLAVSNRAERGPFEYLDRGVERLFPDASIIGRTQGGIGNSGGLKTMYADNLLIAGDAAQLAEPVTGGGIPNALASGQMAGRMAAEAVKAGDVSADALKAYQKEWDSFLGSRQRKVSKVRKAIYSLSDDQYNKLMRRLSDVPFEDRNPRKIVFEALKGMPALIPVVLRALF